jgi:hypothetical protein
LSTWYDFLARPPTSTSTPPRRSGSKSAEPLQGPSERSARIQVAVGRWRRWAGNRRRGTDLDSVVLREEILASECDSDSPCDTKVLGFARPRLPFSTATVVLGCVVATALGLPPEANAHTSVSSTLCNRNQVHEVLAHATDEAQEVEVDCDLSLPRGALVTKRLVLRGNAASGVTIDCNGGTIDGSAVPELANTNAGTNMILIRSAGVGEAWNHSWTRPVDVTVRDCRIVGSVRVVGMRNERNIGASSYRPGYVRRIRRISPSRITFEKLVVVGRGKWPPMYIGDGVTRSKLLGSELTGESESVALYIDAESSRNVIKRNYIHTATQREVVAIDASNFNRIIDNWFSSLSRGGIYLYRNCGEDGVVRRTTPGHNVIVNNIFYYKNYSPSPSSANPSVYLGARNGHRGYCWKDNEHNVGSGASDLDYATHNAVYENQIFKLPYYVMIRHGQRTDTPNFFGYNTTVTTPVSRPAGCYVPTGYYLHFIHHGQSIRKFRRADGSPYLGKR